MTSTNISSRKHGPHQQSRRFLVLFVAAALLTVNATSNRLVSNASPLQAGSVPILTGTFQTINNGPGNQTNPHVSRNLASYTAIDAITGQSTLHYWDFATGTDSVIPGNSIDLLSDISAGRIAFTEVHEDGDHVIVYDTISQTNTIVPGASRSNPAIGGNVVAFEDRIFLPNPRMSEISLYDLSTGTVTRQTSDALFDQNPAV